MKTVLVTLILALSCAPSHCDVGRGTHAMASTRTKRIHGLGGYKQAEGDVQNRGKKKSSDDSKVQVDTSPAADQERAKFLHSYIYAYENYFASTCQDLETGEIKKQSLSKLHYLMIDFENLDILDQVENHSDLHLYLPPKNERGRFSERWLYFPTVDSEPEIQDGPKGPISERFYKTFWQGITLHITGNGRTRCMLVPRNHLKSTVCGYFYLIWRALRDPSWRHVIRCSNSNLAKDFLDPIKKLFETNERFAKLWGNYRSEKRDNVWNTEAIQFDIPQEQRRGAGVTIETAGMATSMTGTHAEDYNLDDIVDEKNSDTPPLLAKTRKVVSDTHAQRVAGSLMRIKGTRWHDDDAYAPIVGEPGRNEWSGSMSHFSSFFVATVLDNDDSVKVPPLPNGLYISPLGRGKPIWPENFTYERLAEIRAGITDDYRWRGQFFNQHIGSLSRVFRREWIQNIETIHPKYKGWATPRMAEDMKLNIFCAADTAGGKPDQSGRVDKTAMFVGGQTPDRSEFYLLDGFCEKLPAERIAYGIVRTAKKWKEIANRYNGFFRIGFEKTRWTNFLGVVLAEECRKQNFTFAFEELSHGSRAKVDRITVLAPRYSEGMFLWPESLMVDPVKQSDDSPQEPYDLRQILETEFVAYHAKATDDNLIDAHAYAFEISFPQTWEPEQGPEYPEALRKPQNTYSREAVLEEAYMGQDMGGYQPELMEAPYV